MSKQTVGPTDHKVPYITPRVYKGGLLKTKLKNKNADNTTALGEPYSEYNKLDNGQFLQRSFYINYG